MNYDDRPTLAECQRDEAEIACAQGGHVLGEDEDGETVCDRCGQSSLDVEPPSEDDEPTPTEDDLADWAQRDVDRIRLADLGTEAA